MKRSGGAGPAQGGTLLIDGRPVTLPVGMEFVSQSPYLLQREGDRLFICKDGQEIGPVELLEPPHFYRLRNREGIPYHQIALLHGTDCLATTI
ncbi:MAG: radical SAM protein, partial [Desulfobacca sp.]|nr:radical SAM protein [Desulfobacca sp.]